jgi:hypothetical protein
VGVGGGLGFIVPNLQHPAGYCCLHCTVGRKRVARVITFIVTLAADRRAKFKMTDCNSRPGQDRRTGSCMHL